METWAVKLANRLAWAFPGRTIDEGHLASWAEEFAELDPDLGEEVVRRLRRDWKNPPAVAELLDVVEEVRHEEGLRRPALPERATWTEEDARRSAEKAPEELARWRAFRAQAGEEADPWALVAHVVSEDEKVMAPSSEEIDRRRRDALAKLDQAYAAELAEARAARMEPEVTEP